VLGPRLYVFGGGGLVDFKVGTISPDGDLSTPLQGAPPSFTEPCDRAASIVVGNFLYVLGGDNGSGAVTNIQRLMLGDL
jgi:hypothetical protein